MGKSLGEHDAAAVDLLLDRTSDANSSNTFATSAGDEVVKRIGIAEHVLRLLAETPAAEPPKDLIQKTMERIRQRGAIAPGTVPSDQPSIGQKPA
jgi:hypothetical protein